MFRIANELPFRMALPFQDSSEFRLSTKNHSLLYYFRIRIASECELEPELVPVTELVIREQILLNCLFAERFRFVTGDLVLTNSILSTNNKPEINQR